MNQSDTVSFAPSVIVAGQTCTPPGWVWILALAINDVPWAVAEASKPEFIERMKGAGVKSDTVSLFQGKGKL